MKAVEILQSVQVGTFFAKMEDGTVVGSFE